MDIVIRAFFAFLFVAVMTRVIGRRELSSLEPFDLILLIVLGDLIQQGVTQSDYSLTGLVLAGGTFTLLTVAVSYLVFRFRRLRPVFEAEPLILVEDGGSSTATCAGSDYARRSSLPRRACSRSRPSPRSTRAVLETSGKISFIPRASG